MLRKDFQYIKGQFFKVALSRFFSRTARMNMKSDWKDWQKTRAYRRLQELARKPYDLTVADALLRDGRLNSYICRSDFFSLFYAGQRVDDQVLAVLQDLADECGLVGQFAAMLRGAVMNRI